MCKEKGKEEEPQWQGSQFQGNFACFPYAVTRNSVRMLTQWATNSNIPAERRKSAQGTIAGFTTENARIAGAATLRVVLDRKKGGWREGGRGSGRGEEGGVGDGVGDENSVVSSAGDGFVVPGGLYACCIRKRRTIITPNNPWVAGIACVQNIDAHTRLEMMLFDAGTINSASSTFSTSSTSSNSSTINRDASPDSNIVYAWGKEEELRKWVNVGESVEVRILIPMLDRFDAMAYGPWLRDRIVLLLEAFKARIGGVNVGVDAKRSML